MTESKECPGKYLGCIEINCPNNIDDCPIFQRHESITNDQYQSKITTDKYGDTTCTIQQNMGEVGEEDDIELEGEIQIPTGDDPFVYLKLNVQINGWKVDKLITFPVIIPTKVLLLMIEHNRAFQEFLETEVQNNDD